MKRKLIASVLVSVLILLSGCGSGAGSEAGKAEASVIGSSSENNPAPVAPSPSDSVSPAAEEQACSESITCQFEADASEYRGGITEFTIEYFDPMGNLYAVESVTYSSPGVVFSDNITDVDGKACSVPDRSGSSVPMPGDGENCEIKENGKETVATWRGETGMKVDNVRYDEAGNPLKWTHFDDKGNIEGWITFSYRFADGSEETGGDM